ncbi:trimethylamine methyltransferase family protein, partial [Alphaproteobacteria bacterium]|nr:trimethylamine methyltransferase family protein [Alphaproteobacteria bacterium]
EIGLSQAPDSGVKYMTDAGAILGEDGRLRFPRGLVEDTLAKCARHITLHGQNPKHDLLLSGSRVHYGTAGAAVHVVDVAKNEYRESYLADIYDAARIVEQMDNIHFFQRPMVARDIPDPADLDFNTVYAAIKGTTKHVGVSFTEAEFMKPVFEMLHSVAGGEDKWRARPFVSNSNCFVVPPLRFATESCLVMEEAVHNGMPVLLLSAGQAGATAPASIAGAVAQALSEVIAGLIYVNAMKPGHPCICGTWPFVSDLRTGAMSGGSGEQGLLTAACAQMLQYYDLPGGAAAGMADAKMPDAQSGYEKGSTLVMAGLSGLNMVYEAAGMHASLLGFCLDSLIIDNDMLGQCLRCVRGIEVNEETLAVQVMKDICMGGPGHYLGHDQTINLMQTEYVYPAIADRSSPKEWEELGKPNLLEVARQRKEDILENSHPSHISDALDAELRARFRILL